MNEVKYQDKMKELINKSLNLNEFICERGAPILYELKVDEQLNIVGDPKNPKRGQGAFETDLAIFDIRNEVKVPCIIIELKEAITSHDIITYSNKASRHKLVYPFIRYGLVAYNLDSIPKRFFRHNQEIDFFLAVKEYMEDDEKLRKILLELIQNELLVFKELQKILHDRNKLNFFQTRIALKNFNEGK